VLLYGQLQSSLAFELTKAPAVSGAKSYTKLFLAARNEEKRLAELRKRQQYGRGQQRYSEQRYSVRQPQDKPNQKFVQNAVNSTPKQPYKQQLV